jgi:uncharacterized protein YdaU (DUF1376 family)
MTYWQRGEPLPNDDKRLARIARMTPDEWADARDTVAEFFVEKDTVWTHKRIDAELKHVAERSKRAKNAGKASAKRRSEVSENIDDSNTRSTDAQRTLNVRSTDAAVPLNHTDTYRKKERKTPPMPPKQNDEPVSAIPYRSSSHRSRSRRHRHHRQAVPRCGSARPRKRRSQSPTHQIARIPPTPRRRPSRKKCGENRGEGGQE